MDITAYDLAQRFVGISEVHGAPSNAQVLAMRYRGWIAGVIAALSLVGSR